MYDYLSLFRSDFVSQVTQYLSLCGDLEPKGFSPSEISRAVDIVGLESARVERLLNGTRVC